MFDQCVSLGYACGTAAAMSKNGLRSFSGPFDWMFSDLHSVIEQIDNEFIDFMKKENLEIVDDHPKAFRDKKWGFFCNHDIIVKENFEIEYAAIYAKYNRRADRFLENIKKPTCFFRMVRSEEEIGYIVDHVRYIEGVLKRYNPKNSIVYILLDGMSPLPNDLKHFRVPIRQDVIGNFYEMRTMFDQAEGGLLQFCKTLLSTEQIDLNIEYDLQKNGHRTLAGEVDYYVRNDIDGIDIKLLNMLGSRDDEAFYIWGGGRYGVRLYRYLIKRGVRIKAIIDNWIINGLSDDISFISPNDIEYGSTIFIAIADEISNFEIKEQIKEKKCKIFTYKDFARYMEDHDDLLD